MHHVEGGGPHLYAGAEVVPEQERAAGHGDDPEQHAPEDEQEDQRCDEGRNDAREDAAVGMLFVPLRVRGPVEYLEQADDELRVDGDAVDEDEDEYPHARPADGRNRHADPDGEPVRVQQVVFNAGQFARVEFLEDEQREHAHGDPAQREDAGRQVGVADQDAEA